VNRRFKNAVFLWICAVVGLCAPCQAYNEIPPKLKDVCIYAPYPDYPLAVIRAGRGGKGIFRLTIDPNTGKVTEVKVLKHLSLVLLDQLSAKAFLQWKFKPHTLTTATIPIQFHATGYTHVYH
jgi:TonB family protein